jgi:hypothetical protein
MAEAPRGDIDAEIAAVRRVGAEALDVLERLPFPFRKSGQRGVAELRRSLATFERLAQFHEDHRDEYDIR